MDENSVIQQFHRQFTSNGPVDIDFIHYIEDEFPNSLILNYYLGMYWKREGDLEMAKEKFYKAIKLNQLFIPPYIELSNGLEHFETVKPLLERIWNRKSYHNGKRLFQLELQLRLSSILVDGYSNSEDGKSIIKIYSTILPKLEKEFDKNNPVHWQCWKTMWKNYGETVRYFDPDEGIRILKKGVEKQFPYMNDKIMITGSMERRIRDMESTIYQAIYLSRFFTVKPIKLPDPKPCYKLWLDNSFKEFHIRKSEDKIRIASTEDSRLPAREKIRIASTEGSRLPAREKIRIAYLSPDFNNNAVGLFLTPLLKHFDRERFEVTCYDNSEVSGPYQKMYSKTLRSYPDINWVKIGSLNDFALANKIHANKTDILVDLIGFGKGNRLETIAMKPAPIIINYLGYPGITGFETHRLVDKFTDPKTEDDPKLVKLNRSFICYHLFDNHELPTIKAKTWSGKIRIGIFNRSDKYSTFIMNAWKKIVKTNRNIELWIKLDYSKRERHRKRFSEFPRDQVNFFDFQDSLPEYMELFNQVDFCVDTYPYSGTTTTCAGLLMGVPTFTIYNPNKSRSPATSNRHSCDNHVSNVTGAIMKWCELEEPFVCSTTKKYVDSVSKFDVETVDKLKIRDQFLKTMDPKAFMKEYESALEELVG